MKSILFALALVLSSTSFASQDKMNCDYEDYTMIREALEDGKVVQGQELSDDLMSLMNQEMGPICFKIPLGLRVGISGTSYFSYEITNGSDGFSVNVSYSEVEDPGFKVTIMPLKL